LQWNADALFKIREGWPAFEINKMGRTVAIGRTKAGARTACPLCGTQEAKPGTFLFFPMIGIPYFIWLDTGS